MSDECRGCITHDCIDPDNLCIMKCYNAKDRCPCVRCLIKVMCRIDCEEFMKLVEEFSNEPSIFSV